MPTPCDHGQLLTADELAARWRNRDHGVARSTPARRCDSCGVMLIQVETAAEVVARLGILAGAR